MLSNSESKEKVNIYVQGEKLEFQSWSVPKSVDEQNDHFSYLKSFQ
jgi:hypothetical protein